MTDELKLSGPIANFIAGALQHETILNCCAMVDLRDATHRGDVREIQLASERARREARRLIYMLKMVEHCAEQLSIAVAMKEVILKIVKE